MKHIHNFLKKSLSSAKAAMCAMVIILIMVSNVYGQTYHLVFMDSVSDGQRVPYCQTICDYLKFAPPAGVTGIYWGYPGNTVYSDTLVLPSGFGSGANGENVSCFYDQNSGVTGITMHALTLPVQPAFTDDTVCGIGTIALDAENANSWGFNTYHWNTGPVIQTITVGAGNYTVSVTNVCGTVTKSAIISKFNPNPPNLGPDDTICQGTSIVLDPGTGFNAYAWTPGTSIADTLSVTTSGTYTLQTTDATSGCVDRDTVIITVLTPQTKPICYVGFDTLNWKNDIYLPTNLSTAIDSFHIYKEVSLGVWNPIGSVAAGTEYFTDMNCNPQNQSYSYKIAVVDTCGNEGALSSPHTTITLLSAYDSGTDTYGFTWSAYVGLSVSDYNLYGIDGTGSVVLIGTVPGNQFFYNYVNPLLIYVKYFIGFDGPDCSAKKSVSLVKSNIVQSSISAGQEEFNSKNIFSYYPNPSKGKVILEIGEKDFVVEILSLLGQVLLTAYNQIELDIRSLQAGTYIVRVTTNNEIEQRKIIVY